MRRVIIGLVVLVALLIAGITYAVVNVNGLLAENRERIEATASEAIGRPLRFERAVLAYDGGIAVRVEGLRVGDDPKFGSEAFLELESAFVGVEIRPALERRLEVSGVRLERPTIRIIQTAAGFNYESLGGTAEAASAGTAKRPEREGEPAGESPPLAMAIAAFEIDAGTILYEDRTASPPLALTIEDFESSGTDLSLTGPVAIEFTGRARPTGGRRELSSQLAGTVEVDDLETGAARLRLRSPSFLPELLGVRFEAEGVGTATERLDQLDLEIGVPADAALNGYPIRLRAGTTRLAGLDLERVDGAFLLEAGALSIQRLVLGIAGGEAVVSGGLTFGETNASPFDLRTHLEKLDAGVLAKMLFGYEAGALSGRIEGDIELAGNGFERKDLERSLAGRVRLEMNEGVLENFNLLDRVVGQLLADPGLGALAAASIQDAAPDSLDGNRTKFKDARLSLSIARGAIRADALRLSTGDFSLGATGSLGLDGRMAGDGRLEFSKEVSRAIRKRADKYAALLGDGERIDLPLRFGGRLGAPTLTADVSAFVARAQGNASKELQAEAAKDLADALFGKRKKKKEPKPGETVDPKEAQREAEREAQRDAAEGLIREGLGRFLGGDKR